MKVNGLLTSGQLTGSEYNVLKGEVYNEVLIINQRRDAVSLLEG